MSKIDSSKINETQGDKYRVHPFPEHLEEHECNASDTGIEASTQNQREDSSSRVGARLLTHTKLSISKHAAERCCSKKNQGPIREIIVYGIFITLFCVSIFGRLNQLTPSEMVNALSNRLLPARDDLYSAQGIQKAFEAIETEADFWDFLTYTWVQALEPDKDVNGFNKAAPYALSYLMGDIRLVQKRAKPGKDCPEWFGEITESNDTECYRPYWESEESRETYGATNTFTWSEDPQASLNSLMLRPDSKYGSGGFSEYLRPLPYNQTALEEQILKLKSEQWIDDQTRAVFMDMSFSNPFVDLFATFRLVFEFPTVGGCSPSVQRRIIDPFQYSTTTEKALFIVECLFIVLYSTYVIEEIVEIFTEGAQYWRDGWNYIDITNLLCFFVVICLRAATDYTAVGLKEQIVAGKNYVNWQPMAYSINQLRNLNAFNAVLCWLKCFKYLAISEKMSMFTRVLSNAAKDILVFLLIFFIVFVGFAQGFFIAFHVNVNGFETFASSLFSLFRSILGEFDFQGLQRENWLLGPLLFICFIVLVFMVLTNVFLAILNDAYTEVRTKMSTTKDPFAEKLSEAMSGITKKLAKIFKKGSEYGDAAVADAEKNLPINRNELVAKLAENRRGSVAGDRADAILQAYDKNKDGLLDSHEQKAMSGDASVRELIQQLQSQHRINEIAASEALEQRFNQLSQQIVRLSQVIEQQGSAIGKRANSDSKARN